MEQCSGVYKVLGSFSGTRKKKAEGKEKYKLDLARGLEFADADLKHKLPWTDFPAIRKWNNLSLMNSSPSQLSVF